MSAPELPTDEQSALQYAAYLLGTNVLPDLNIRKMSFTVVSAKDKNIRVVIEILIDEEGGKSVSSFTIAPHA